MPSLGGVQVKIASAVAGIGEGEFLRRMEEFSSAERREIFQRLHIPSGGISASARQRNRRRIRLAWEHLQETGDEEAAEMFVRSWLGRCGMPMIIEFLDRFDVKHQGGYLQDVGVLKQLPPKEVARALDELQRKYDSGDVRLYAALMSLPYDEDGRAAG